MRHWGFWSVRGAWFAGATVLGVVAGCARDRGPARWNGFSRLSTAGSDLREAPRGVTVPPPALGVDLVRRPDVGPARDPEAGRAGATR